MSESPLPVEVLRDLAEALSGKRWYLFGAQAAVLWGASRLSDVDVTVEIAGDDPRSFAARMERSGLSLFRRDRYYLSFIAIR